MNHSFHEITPLTTEDCLLVFDRHNKKFDFPVHFHIEYELNFMHHASGARRIAGDHEAHIDNLELVLVGPNLVHGWEQGKCRNRDVREITIQFHRDLFHPSLLGRNAMKPIKKLLEDSTRGVAFSKQTVVSLQSRIENMVYKKGSDALIELISILNVLSVSPQRKLLSSIQKNYNDRYHERINKVYEYIEKHFEKRITLQMMAELLNMTIISFTRLIRQRTGKTFIDFLNDYRLSHASRMLLETEKSISEIAYLCGFNNQSNFNRIFKKKNECTPSEYKDNFVGMQRIH